MSKEKIGRFDKFRYEGTFGKSRLEDDAGRAGPPIDRVEPGLRASNPQMEMFRRDDGSHFGAVSPPVSVFPGASSRDIFTEAAKMARRGSYLNQGDGASVALPATGFQGGLGSGDGGPRVVALPGQDDFDKEISGASSLLRTSFPEQSFEEERDSVAGVPRAGTPLKASDVEGDTIRTAGFNIGAKGHRDPKQGALQEAGVRYATPQQYSNQGGFPGEGVVGGYSGGQYTPSFSSQNVPALDLAGIHRRFATPASLNAPGAPQVSPNSTRRADDSIQAGGGPLNPNFYSAGWGASGGVRQGVERYGGNNLLGPHGFPGRQLFVSPLPDSDQTPQSQHDGRAHSSPVSQPSSIQYRSGSDSRAMESGRGALFSEMQISPRGSYQGGAGSIRGHGPSPHSPDLQLSSIQNRSGSGSGAEGYGERFSDMPTSPYGSDQESDMYGLSSSPPPLSFPGSGVDLMQQAGAYPFYDPPSTPLTGRFSALRKGQDRLSYDDSSSISGESGNRSGSFNNLLEPGQIQLTFPYSGTEAVSAGSQPTSMNNVNLIDAARKAINEKDKTGSSILGIDLKNYGPEGQAGQHSSASSQGLPVVSPPPRTSLQAAGAEMSRTASNPQQDASHVEAGAEGPQIIVEMIKNRKDTSADTITRKLMGVSEETVRELERQIEIEEQSRVQSKKEEEERAKIKQQVSTFQVSDPDLPSPIPFRIAGGPAGGAHSDGVLSPTNPALGVTGDGPAGGNLGDASGSVARTPKVLAVKQHSGPVGGGGGPAGAYAPAGGAGDGGPAGVPGGGGGGGAVVANPAHAPAVDTGAIDSGLPPAGGAHGDGTHNPAHPAVDGGGGGPAVGALGGAASVHPPTVVAVPNPHDPAADAADAKATADKAAADKAKADKAKADKAAADAKAAADKAKADKAAADKAKAEKTAAEARAKAEKAAADKATAEKEEDEDKERKKNRRVVLYPDSLDNNRRYKVEQITNEINKANKNVPDDQSFIKIVSFNEGRLLKHATKKDFNKTLQTNFFEGHEDNIKTTKEEYFGFESSSVNVVFGSLELAEGQHIMIGDVKITKQHFIDVKDKKNIRRIFIDKDGYDNFMKYRNRLYEKFLHNIGNINDIKDSKSSGESSGLNELLNDLNSIDGIAGQVTNKAAEARTIATAVTAGILSSPSPTHTESYNQSLARKLAYEFLARRITKGNISFEQDIASSTLAPAPAPALAPVNTFETKAVSYVEVKRPKDKNKIEVSIGNGISKQLQYVNVGLKHDITMQIKTFNDDGSPIGENEGVKVKYYDEDNTQLTGKGLKREGIRDKVDVVVRGENETKVYKIRGEEESKKSYWLQKPKIKTYITPTETLLNNASNSPINVSRTYALNDQRKVKIGEGTLLPFGISQSCFNVNIYLKKKGEGSYKIRYGENKFRGTGFGFLSNSRGGFWYNARFLKVTHENNTVKRNVHLEKIEKYNRINPNLFCRTARDSGIEVQVQTEDGIDTVGVTKVGSYGHLLSVFTARNRLKAKVVEDFSVNDMDKPPQGPSSEPNPVSTPSPSPSPIPSRKSSSASVMPPPSPLASPREDAGGVHGVGA